MTAGLWPIALIYWVRLALGDMTRPNTMLTQATDYVKNSMILEGMAVALNHFKIALHKNYERHSNFTRRA
jgi:hypothetical protein